MRLCISPILLLFFLSILLSDDKTYHLDHAARVEFPVKIWSAGDTSGVSDCWGYVDKEGNDYAIVGVLDGTAIVRVQDLKIITTISGPEYGDMYYHRDMMTYGDYLYVCHEMTGTNQGVNIIDLSPLPDSVRYVKSYDNLDYAGSYASTSHNLFVDEATATLYLVRSSYDGFRVVSLDDPENLKEIGVAETPGIHDLFSRKDTVFVAEGYNKSFSIWDATDKENGPKLLERVNDNFFNVTLGQPAWNFSRDVTINSKHIIWTISSSYFALGKYTESLDYANRLNAVDSTFNTETVEGIQKLSIEISRLRLNL